MAIVLLEFYVIPPTISHLSKWTDALLCKTRIELPIFHDEIRFRSDNRQRGDGKI